MYLTIVAIALVKIMATLKRSICDKLTFTHDIFNSMAIEFLVLCNALELLSKIVYGENLCSW
jgi:hypothetical protein